MNSLSLSLFLFLFLFLSLSLSLSHRKHRRIEQCSTTSTSYQNMSLHHETWPKPPEGLDLAQQAPV
jgi:hypothetical protein